MKFDFKKNPAGVADASYVVTGVAAVSIRGEHYLASTDGSALVLIAAEPSPEDALDAERVYPAAAIAAARKAFGAIDLRVDGAAVPGVASYPALAERFPASLLDGIIPTEAFKHVFFLDAERLARIQRALGAAGVRIEWHGDECPMVVRPVAVATRRGKPRKSDPATVDGSYGVLMPIAGDAEGGGA
jgi:hypothetical protein